MDILAALLALSAATATATAATAPPSPHPLRIEDAVGMRTLVPVLPPAAFSPDGALIAHTVCDPRKRREDESTTARRDATRFTAGCAIHVVAPSGGRTIIVDHPGANWAPVWSPDGQGFAFYGDDADGVHLWLWDRDARQARRVSDAVVDVATGEELPLWTGDGKRLISRLPGTALATRRAAPAPTITAAWVAPGGEGATVSVMQSGHATRPERAPSPGYTAVDLATIDVASGRTERLAQTAAIGAYWPSPDGRFVAYSVNTGMPHGQRSYRWTLGLIDLAGNGHSTLATFDQFHGTSVRWAPDSRSLAYFSGHQDTSQARAFVVAVDGTAPRRLAGATDFGTQTRHVPLWNVRGTHLYAIDKHTLWRGDVRSGQFTAVGTWPDHDLLRIVPTARGNEAWSPDGGGSLDLVVRDHASRRNELLRVSLATGTVRVLRDERLSISAGPVPSPDGRTLAFAAQSAQQPQDLWLAAANDLTDARRLTRLNPELEAYRFGETRLIDFHGLDGRPLKATLLLPPDHVPGQRHPLVAWVYGGSLGSDQAWRFGLSMPAFNLHMLASHGYAVLYPDIPLQTGAPVQSLVNAVMPAIDAAIDQGYADAKRLAVMGQSSGGYGALALTTRTDRFKAAIVCAGFGELASFHGHGWGPWLEHGDGAIGKAPWEAPERYVENSPVYVLDRITTPLLLQAGGDDPAAGKFPAQVFAGLRQLDKPATYIEYAGEGHVLSRPANLVDFWQRVTAFLDHYLQLPAREDDE